LALVEVRMPRYPQCWESCGACGSGDVFVLEVLVAPGETVRADDNVITLETGKVALDIPSPHGGRVVEVCVEAGQILAENDLILTLET
jgi:pyruvate/2-oxoglutarate dehydrogenase complex dihydrolipoamide acyltransferase (E2) component